jgi:hypothetical protein
VNLPHANTWKAPVDALLADGEQRVTLPLPAGRRSSGARLLVAGSEARFEAHVEGDREEDTVGVGGDITAVVPSILDHEVVVIELSG